MRLVGAGEGSVALLDGVQQFGLGSLEVAAQLRLDLPGCFLLGGHLGPQGGEVIEQLVTGSGRLGQVEAYLVEGGGELLESHCGLGGGGVCFGLLRFGASLGLLGPGGAGVGGGDLLGGLTGDRFELCFDGLGVPDGAELMDQDAELLAQVLDHPRDLAGDHARPLPCRVDRIRLSQARLHQLLPRTPRSRPGVTRVVAVLRRTARAVGRHRRLRTPREAARPLVNLLRHNVTIP